MWLSDFTLVLANRVVPSGSVRLEGDMIAEVVEHPVPEGMQGHGATLFAGFIDMHGDMIEQELEPRARVDFPMRVALGSLDARLAAAGVTTAYAAVSFSRGAREGERRSFEHTSGVIRDLAEARVGCRVEHLIHARFDITFDNAVGVLADLLDEGRVDLVSLMDHTPGQRQFRDVTKLEAYVKGKHGFDDAGFQRHIAELKQMRDTYGDKHEIETVKAARRFGAVLASHDDTTAEQVAVSADHGIHLAEFPTTVEAARACHAHDIKVMMGAPNLIRGGSHSGNVAAKELADLELLDIVSSDYVPAALLMSAVKLGEIWGDMARGLATVTRSPADAVRLEDRGRIEVDKRADLIRFRMRGGTPALRGVWSRGHRVA